MCIQKQVNRRQGSARTHITVHAGIRGCERTSSGERLTQKYFNPLGPKCWETRKWPFSKYCGSILCFIKTV